MNITKFSNTIVEQFILFLSVDRGLSPSSISSYHRDIQLFLKITAITSPEEISQDSVCFFVETLHQRKEAESTLARRLIALKVFFRFLKEARLLSHTPRIEHPKVWKRLPSVLSLKEVDALLKFQSPCKSRQLLLLVIVQFFILCTQQVSVFLNSVDYVLAMLATNIFA